MTTAEDTGVRRCAWNGGEGVLSRCGEEAVATVTVWVLPQTGDGPETHKTRRACRAHISSWIDYFWDFLGEEGSFRVRQTAEYRAKRLVAAS